MNQPFIISRLLDAPRQLVWQVYTQPEHLAKWLGPKGSTIIHSDIDFRVGGIYLYALEFNGMTIWGKWQFREITPIEKIVLIQCFSDEHAGVTRHPMAPVWPLKTHSITTLVEQGNKTLLTLNWQPYEATAEEIAVFDASHDSMNQGWGGNFDVLDAYLASLRGKA